MANNVEGIIKGINGQIAEVEIITETVPAMLEILHCVEEKNARLEVYIQSRTSVSCLILSNPTKLSRGMKVFGTGNNLQIPVGKTLLGKAVNLFGDPIMPTDTIDPETTMSIYAKTASINVLESKFQILETGIKAIDFLTPIFKGGKVGFVGGAGVGKTILITEMIHNITMKSNVIASTFDKLSVNSAKQSSPEEIVTPSRLSGTPRNDTSEKNTISVFAGVGERIREGQELYHRLKESKVLDNTVIVLGQMNENAAVRFRVALAATTIAEYFRDAYKQDVLFFIDNMFRFLQAGNEVSTVLGMIPSDQGYQPTLQTEISHIEDRLISTENGSITSIQTVYVPSDEATDPAVTAIMSFLDSSIVLSRSVAQQGLYPPLDVFQSTSSAASSKNVVGIEHFEALTNFQRMLDNYNRLSHIVAIVGESELSSDNRILYNRTKKVINYLTQPFFMTEAQTGQKGVYVKRETTVKDVSLILSGKLDEIPSEKFLYIGSLREASITS